MPKNMNKVITSADKTPGKQRLTWMLLLLLLLVSACQEPVRKYLKARTPEELKTNFTKQLISIIDMMDGTKHEDTIKFI